MIENWTSNFFVWGFKYVPPLLCKMLSWTEWVQNRPNKRSKLSKYKQIQKGKNVLNISTVMCTSKYILKTTTKARILTVLTIETTPCILRLRSKPANRQALLLRSSNNCRPSFRKRSNYWSKLQFIVAPKAQSVPANVNQLVLINKQTNNTISKAYHTSQA